MNLSTNKAEIYEFDMSPSKMEKDTLIKLKNHKKILQENSNFEYDPSDVTFTGWLTLLFEIFRDGNVGAVTFLMTVCGTNIQIFEMGHLPNSKLMISSIGSAIAYLFIMAACICGFNSSLLNLVSRCKATNDFKRMKKFVKLG